MQFVVIKINIILQTIANDPNLSRGERKQLRAQRKKFKREYEALGQNFDQEVMEENPETMEQALELAEEVLDSYEPRVSTHICLIQFRCQNKTQ